MLGSRRVARPRHGRGPVPQRRERVFALLDRCPTGAALLSQGIVFGKSVACPLLQLDDWPEQRLRQGTR